MSGLVRVRYWRAPTRLRDFVASERGGPSYAESFEPDARGVGHGLESCIGVRVSRSKVYLVWVKTRAVDVRLASIPKKKFRSPRSAHGEVRTQSLNERKETRGDWGRTVVLRKILLRTALWLDRREVNSGKDRRLTHIRARFGTRRNLTELRNSSIHGAPFVVREVLCFELDELLEFPKNA